MVIKSNPFTPSFGGRPEYFFGRTDIIERFDHALEDDANPDRVLFITGNRGCGKTALLERLSQRAAEARWLVIDVHSSHAAEAIWKRLDADVAGVSVEVSPKFEVLGMRATLGTASTNRTSVDLMQSLIRRCDHLGSYRGILLTIDEIQKIPETDMEEICAAVQMTRRKGLPVMMYMAGLPRSKEKVASYEGCTFMQRVRDETISALLISETISAYAGLLGLVSNLEVTEDVIWELGSFSQGYPYLMQLVGYRLIEALRAKYPVGVITPTIEDVLAIEDEAYTSYRDDVLVPATRGIGSEARSYLAAMATLLDDNGIARTGQVAQELGKRASQLSACRQRLIDRRLIVAQGHGAVRFGLPHLSRFAVEKHTPTNEHRTDMWPTR